MSLLTMIRFKVVSGIARNALTTEGSIILPLKRCNSFLALLMLSGAR